jgi:hypothetical protein
MASQDLVRVLIATTLGPIEVEGITDLGPSESSIVVLGAGSDLIPAMRVPYRNFIAKGSGVIARSFGHEAFRLELSGEIHIGESWQLAIFIAHALHKAGRLAKKGERAPKIVWATGQVDYYLRVSQIGHIHDKIASSLPRFSAARDAGYAVHVFWPKANESDADELTRERLAALGISIHEIDQTASVLPVLDLPVQASNADALVWSGAPYKGLEAFGQDEEAIFFGRGRAREEALEQLRTAAAQGAAFLLIHGSSGSGKSSLARAGMLNAILRASDEAEDWRVAVMPTVQKARTPLQALAEAMCTALPGLKGAAHPGLLALTRENPAAAVDRIVAQLKISGAHQRSKLGLLVDQLEDVLLWGEDGPAEIQESQPDRT